MLIGGKELSHHIKKYPINSQLAQTYWAEEKKIIDDFIINQVEGGFEGLNKILTDAADTTMCSTFAVSED